MQPETSHANWGWLTPYSGALIGVLFAGSFFSTRPFLQAIQLGPTGLSASVAAHVLTNVLSLALVYVIAHRAATQLPQDGAGSSFFRAILRPTAALAVCTLLGRSVGDLLAPHLDHTLHTYGKYALIAGLIGAGLWFTFEWLRHLQELGQWLNGSPRPVRSKPLTAVQEARVADNAEEELPAADPEEAHREEPTSVAAEELVGSSLGRYRILKEIGHGSMGVVYLGKDPTIQRFVAVKTVPLAQGDDEGESQEIKKSFFREAESAGRLSHPNIVTIYDAGEQGGLGYIAMEYLEGLTLKHACQPGKLLPLSQAVNLVVTVADALDYAHRQGIVHRDIKPANILVTQDHRIKVTDFGIAKMASSTKTHSNVILGTPSYMPPEQASGKKVDGRADIFSLGIVLYELLTGVRPFTGDDVVSLLYQIATEPHPPITTHRRDLPDGVVQALDRALKKDPAHRFAKAGDFGHALRVALQAAAA